MSAERVRGETPIQQLEQEVLQIRKFRETMGKPGDHNLEASERAALECLRILKQVQKDLHGCTCGECLDGLISPRMKLALKVRSSMINDTLVMENHGKRWMEWQSHNFSPVDPDIQKLFRRDADLREAYANVFMAISSCLEDGSVPYTSNILWKGKYSNYPIAHFKGLGDEVGSALGHCFRAVQSQDEDGSHLEAFKENIENLLKCENDSDFERVPELCGLDDGTTWG
ncbi:uncharacterized protein LY89DRAFT_787401 [Mollisia scopiformis]|uniref:Uncharacterized protein n=1 Tax=Mollisia scopiformis TaxID=149040 RepID=A0A132BF65_MOLSC|nr:uncharacterized protein LY89DRAFT_787401 [Mollisia scopiformis]KUJ10347.1 hypothetical protein LY89DRAFT_787401 [Mollisia scopiformis]